MKERSRGYCDNCEDLTRHLDEGGGQWKCMVCGTVVVMEDHR